MKYEFAFDLQKKAEEISQEIYKDIIQDLNHKTLDISEWKEDLEKFIIKDFMKLNKYKISLQKEPENPVLKGIKKDYLDNLMSNLDDQ